MLARRRIALVACVLGCAAVAVGVKRWHGSLYDDAYIYFRYADHVVEGGGHAARRHLRQGRQQGLLQRGVLELQQVDRVGSTEVAGDPAEVAHHPCGVGNDADVAPLHRGPPHRHLLDVRTRRVRQGQQLDVEGPALLLEQVEHDAGHRRSEALEAALAARWRLVVQPPLPVRNRRQPLRWVSIGFCLDPASERFLLRDSQRRMNEINEQMRTGNDGGPPT